MERRARDPCSSVDPDALVLVRGPALYQAEDAAETYEDTVEAGAGTDEGHGGFGEDTLIGASRGDELNGDTGNDSLYGGAGPNSTSSIISFYNEDGLRYDQFGNLLPEDDDILFGGEGDDLLDGSSGHDTADGGTGNDTLNGDAGNDEMWAGTGEDELNGGDGNDWVIGRAHV